MMPLARLFEQPAVPNVLDVLPVESSPLTAVRLRLREQLFERGVLRGQIVGRTALARIHGPNC